MSSKHANSLVSSLTLPRHQKREPPLYPSWGQTWRLCLRKPYGLGWPTFSISLRSLLLLTKAGWTLVFAYMDYDQMSSSGRWSSGAQRKKTKLVSYATILIHNPITITLTLWDTYCPIFDLDELEIKATRIN